MNDAASNTLERDIIWLAGCKQVAMDALHEILPLITQTKNLADTGYEPDTGFDPTHEIAQLARQIGAIVERTLQEMTLVPG